MSNAIAPAIATKVKKSKMVWPAEKELAYALLLTIVQVYGGRVILKTDRDQLLKSLADNFGLSRNQRKLPHPTAGTKWSSKVQWAKLGLVKAGLLDPEAPRGTWTIVGYSSIKAPVKAIEAADKSIAPKKKTKKAA